MHVELLWKVKEAHTHRYCEESLHLLSNYIVCVQYSAGHCISIISFDSHRLLFYLCLFISLEVLLAPVHRRKYLQSHSTASKWKAVSHVGISSRSWFSPKTSLRSATWTVECFLSSSITWPYARFPPAKGRLMILPPFCLTSCSLDCYPSCLFPGLRKVFSTEEFKNTMVKINVFDLGSKCPFGFYRKVDPKFWTTDLEL